MCGIVGATSFSLVSHRLIDGLKRLAYRGYDSAGIAIINDEAHIKRLRLKGKVEALEQVLQTNPIDGLVGIAHTRWATHGIPSESNAHPFISHDQLALVHNGIIENDNEIKQKLKLSGYQFSSDTDSETIVHLIHFLFQAEHDLMKVLYETSKTLKGAFALGIICTDYPNYLIAIKKGSPLVIGCGESENFIASDPLALLSYTNNFIYLEDDDIAIVTPNDIQVYNQNKKVDRKKQQLQIDLQSVDKSPYKHFMQKEIMEQADAIAQCLEGRLADHFISPQLFGPRASFIFPKVKHVQLVACGTSYHAAMIAAHWIEEIAKIPCTFEIASEFRYRKVAKPTDSLFVTLSQSGETADTLGALRLAKKMGYLSTLVICNVPGSTMMRDSELQFLTHAGIEIGVASTKSFLAQLVSLFLLALVLNKGQSDEIETYFSTLKQLPELISSTLNCIEVTQKWARKLADKNHIIFLGRGLLYPVALEGALKMKEISYIHAEAFPAGELKHGPLALVDSQMPVICLVPQNYLFEKMLSNLQEVLARGGQLMLLTNQESTEQLGQKILQSADCMMLPIIHPNLLPILYTIPLQLLAYQVGLLKGNDIDQPRHLAKSVTVE